MGAEETSSPAPQLRERGPWRTSNVDDEDTFASLPDYEAGSVLKHVPMRCPMRHRTGAVSVEVSQCHSMGLLRSSVRRLDARHILPRRKPEPRG